MEDAHPWLNDLLIAALGRMSEIELKDVKSKLDQARRLMSEGGLDDLTSTRFTAYISALELRLENASRPECDISNDDASASPKGGTS